MGQAEIRRLGAASKVLGPFGWPRLATCGSGACPSLLRRPLAPAMPRFWRGLPAARASALVQADGDVVGRLPTQVDVLPRALRLIR